MSWYRRDGSDLILQIRVQPRASRDGFADVMDDYLKVRLTAPPVEGKANEQLMAFLAKAFGVPKSRVTLERGETSRHKQIRILNPSRLPDLPGLTPK